MGKYSAERREELFALMRARQKLKEEIAQGAPPERPLSLAAHRRRERRKVEGLPARLRMYRVAEVAEMLAVSRQTVSVWFWDRAVKVGTPRPGRRPKYTLLISLQALEDWVREHSCC